MIELTKLNGIKFVLNEDKIETIHENPDTTIILINGSLYIVQESMIEIIEMSINYKNKIGENTVQSMSR